MQEFQLLTGQFDAEFGSTSGGVVNAVSKQGTNLFHGVLFFFNQNQSMTSLDYFAKQQGLAKPEAQQKQWGGNIGGPLVKDKLHFFVNLERIDQNRARTIKINARPELNFTDFTHDNVWNWMAARRSSDQRATTRGPCAGCANRRLRAISSRPRPSRRVRAEEETDTDWTMVGTLNSVRGNTKGQHAQVLVHARGRVLRQPGVFRDRRPGGCAPQLALPDVY